MVWKAEDVSIFNSSLMAMVAYDDDAKLNSNFTAFKHPSVKGLSCIVIGHTKGEGLVYIVYIIIPGMDCGGLLLEIRSRSVCTNGIVRSS